MYKKIYFIEMKI